MAKYNLDPLTGNLIKQGTGGGGGVGGGPAFTKVQDKTDSFTLTAADDKTIFFVDSSAVADPGSGLQVFLPDNPPNGFMVRLVNLNGTWTDMTVSIFSLGSTPIDVRTPPYGVGTDAYVDIIYNSTTGNYHIIKPDAGLFSFNSNYIFDFSYPMKLNGNNIKEVADPVDDQDAATKAYVDASGGGGGGSYVQSNLTTVGPLANIFTTFPGNTDSSLHPGTSDDIDKIAFIITVSDATNISKITYKGYYDGTTPSGTVVARILSDSSSSPGTVLATSEPIDIASLMGSSYANIEFNFATPYSAVPGNYWIELQVQPGAVYSGTNFRLKWTSVSPGGGAYTMLFGTSYTLYGGDRVVFSVDSLTSMTGTVLLLDSDGKAMNDADLKFNTTTNTLSIAGVNQTYSKIFSGPTSSRTASPSAGCAYFDTTINKPIWYSGSAWVDATGSSV